MGLTLGRNRTTKAKPVRKKANKVGDRKEYMKRSAESTFQTGEMSE